MNALVTGGSGFLGLHITEQLVERGDRVRVFSRRPPALESPAVEWTAGDVRDAEAVSRACRGMDVAFHVAGAVGIWGAWKTFFETNTLGTRHVIAACRQAGVSRLVFTSSPSVVYDARDHRNVDETHPYASRWLCHYPHSKALAEQEVLAANGTPLEPQGTLLTCALRPHLIWGPRDNQLVPRLIRRAKSGRLRRIGDGTNLISMSYVENAAAAHLQAADALAPGSPVAGQAYFINEPEPVNLWDWINDLLARAGLAPVRKALSARAAWRTGAVIEGLYRMLRLPGEPPMTRFLASQLSGSHFYDVSKARRDFGYAPPIPVEEGMRRLEPELRRLAQGSSP